MNPYALIDLHCDTLTDCIHKGLTFTGHSFMPSSSRISTAGRLPSITTKQTVTILTARWKNFMTASPPAVPIPICMLHGRQERRPLF